MKRVLSLFLCFVLLISVFSSTAVVSLAASADRFFSVKEGSVKDKTITYTINLASGLEGVGGACLFVEFDSSVLKPVVDKCEPALKSNGSKQFEGMYTAGYMENRDDAFAVSYMNTSPVSTSTVTPFFVMKFEVIDETRPNTSLAFYCKEFYSTVSADECITPENGPQLIKEIKEVSTLEPPKLNGAVLGTGKITVSWEAAEGANGYVIRRESADSGREIIAEVNADVLQYEDTDLKSGTIYTYYVQSSKGSVNSLYGEGVSCKYVAKPENVKAVNGIGGVELTWDAVAGADGYLVVRREINADGSKGEWEKLITRTTPSYKDVKVTNGKTYEYDVNSQSGSFVTESLEDGVAVTYIESPDIISVINEKDGILLNWKALPNASYYVVYRKSATVGSNVDFSQIDIAYDSFYLDKAVTAGRGYTYTVVAVSENGESALRKTGSNITRVPATVVTNVATGSDNITVFWDAVDTVSGYYIYRKTEISEWEKVGSVKGTVSYYKDSSAISGNDYYYAVAPYIGNYEAAKISTAESIYYISAPENIVENVKTGIRIEWSAVNDAESYKLYKKIGDNGEFVLIKEINKGEKLSFIDEDVIEGELYRYSLVSVGSKGESIRSSTDKATMRISCITKFSAVKLADGVEVDWRHHPDANSYIIIRKEDGVWKELAQVEEPEYVDKTVTSGKSYAYAVIPVVNGYVGGYDEALVSEFEFLAAPVLKVANKKSNAVVSWNAVGGAKKYVLKRATVNSSGETGSYKTIATVSYKVKEYIDENVSAGAKYKYVIYTIDGSEKSVASKAVTNVFMKIPPITKLANAYGGAKVSWSGVKGAKEYVVYRKFSGEKSWTKLATISASKLSYVDKGAKNNVKVSYLIKAKNGSCVSAYESKSFTYFAAPTLTVKNTDKGIKLSWNKISGAKSYYIYRKGPGEASWQKIATSTKTSYGDEKVKNGKDYIYTIKAYNGSTFSGYNTSGWKLRRLSVPKITSVKNDAKTITVTWGKVAGASSYNVYRKLKGEDSWTKVSSKQKGTGFVDKNVKNGKVYVYTVKAVYSSSVSHYDTEGVALKRLAPPEAVSAVSSKSGITVRWESVTGAKGYNVYRKTGSAGYKKIGTVSGNGTVKYVDKNAKKGTTYYYKIRAVSGISESASSSALKCKDKY